MEKTHCLEFGRYARENAYKRGEKPKEFTFLGFTHYCGKNVGAISHRNILFSRWEDSRLPATGSGWVGYRYATS